MKESSSTKSGDETTQTGHCAVWWCATDHRSNADHDVTSGEPPWTVVYATADPKFGVADVEAHPSWYAGCEQPQVTLWIQKRRPGTRGEVDLQLDLRPNEALQLAGLLERAAAAAQSPGERAGVDGGDGKPGTPAQEMLCDVIEELHKIEGRIDDALGLING